MLEATSKRTPCLDEVGRKGKINYAKEHQKQAGLLPYFRTPPHTKDSLTQPGYRVIDAVPKRHGTEPAVSQMPRQTACGQGLRLCPLQTAPEIARHHSVNRPAQFRKQRT